MYDELAAFYTFFDIDKALEFIGQGVETCMMLINTTGKSRDLTRYLSKSYARSSLLVEKKGDLETAHKYAAYAAEIGATLEAEE